MKPRQTGRSAGFIKLYCKFSIFNVRRHQADIGLPLLWVIYRKRVEAQLGLTANDLNDQLGQFLHGKFTRVAHIYRAGETVAAAHHLDETIDKVVYITELTGLLTISIKGDVFSLQCLDNEIANHAAITGVHPGAISVENTGHFDVQGVLPVLIKEQGFSTALAFIVAGAGANRIDPPPVLFTLRMHFWVAIDFACGCLEYLRVDSFRQAQHVDGTMHAGLGGLDRVMLIMYGAGRASQVIDLVNLNIKREGDVMAHHFKIRVVHQVGNVGFIAGEKVVHTQNVVPLLDQPIA